MLFQIYGEGAIYQLLGCVLVFAGLVICNELARRSKFAGCRREVLHFACRAASGCAGARYCLGEGCQTLDRRPAAATEGQPDAGGLCRPGAAARTRAFRLS